MWFTRFQGCHDDWSLAVLHEQIIHREVTIKDKEGAWLTKAQIVDLYKCEIVANAVITEASEDGDRWRRHPQATQCDEAVQYWVTVSEKQTERLEDIVSKGVSLSANVGMAEGIQVASKLAPARISTSGPSPSLPPARISTSGQSPSAVATNAGAGGGNGAGNGAADVAGEADRAAMLQKSQTERSREEAQKKRDEKTAAEKARNEAYKNTPHGKAQAWLKACTTKLTDIAALVTQTTDASKDDPQTSALYKEKFDAHSRNLKSLRQTIEEALQGTETLTDEEAERVSTELASASRLLDNFKSDRRAWGGGVVYRLADNTAGN